MRAKPRGLDDNRTRHTASPQPAGRRHRPFSAGLAALLLVGCVQIPVRQAWIRPTPEEGTSRDRAERGSNLADANRPGTLVRRLGELGFSDRDQPPIMPHRTDLPVFAELASHVWVTPRFVGEVTENLELEVLTFNVHGLPRWLGGPPADQFDRIAAAIQEEAADIVLLQEAWTRAARRSSPRGQGWNIATGIRDGSFFEQSGLVTASRFRIIGGEFRRFSRASFPDSLVEKGALKVTLELPGGQRVNVWNVHLQAGRAAHVRTHQVAELIRWVLGAADGQAMDLVGGDFNCTPDSPEYGVLAGSLGDDIRCLDGRPHEPTFPEHARNGRRSRTLDYVFWSPRAPLRVTAARSEVVFNSERAEERLSDHLGVRASLAVAALPAPGPVISPSLVGLQPEGVKIRRLLKPFRETD